MKAIPILTVCITALTLSCSPGGSRILFEDDSGQESQGVVLKSAYDPGSWKMAGAGEGSPGPVLFCRTPVPEKCLHYDISFRQYSADSAYTGYIIGAGEMDPDQGIEFGCGSRVPGTDSTAGTYVTGAFGEKALAGMILMHTWADHRIEVRDNWVAWYINDALVSLAELSDAPIHGYFGIRQLDGPDTRFDDVKITCFF